jgi:excisionase family DNA binding protein
MIMATVSKHGKIRMPGLSFDNMPSGAAFELLTPQEVADLLKISLTGVRRLQGSRLIPFIKIGGSIRFSKSDILSYLMNQRVMPPGQ